MNQQIWQTWINNINWILDISKKRSWDVEDIEIIETVRPDKIEQLEKELGIEYPVDFKKILTDYSSGVKLSWQIEGEETEGEFSGIFCGGGDGYLFDFNELGYCFDNYKGWLEDCFSNPEDELLRELYFGDVINGQMIFSDIWQKSNGFWKGIPEHFKFVRLDKSQIMPNHVHRLIEINHNLLKEENISDNKMLIGVT